MAYLECGDLSTLFGDVGNRISSEAVTSPRTPKTLSPNQKPEVEPLIDVLERELALE